MGLPSSGPRINHQLRISIGLSVQQSHLCEEDENRTSPAWHIIATMLTERLGSQLTLLRVQQAVAELGTAAVLGAVLAVLAAVLAVDYGRMLYLRWQMPPGPFPWPVVGNTFSLPEHKPWIYFEELSRKYKAPLITFWIGR